MGKKRNETRICHLCGLPRTSEEKGDEHIPPQRYFPKELRQLLKGQVQFIPKQPAHQKCNQSYQHDEAYFFWRLGLDSLNDFEAEVPEYIYRELYRRFEEKEWAAKPLTSVRFRSRPFARKDATKGLFDHLVAFQNS